MKIYIAGPYSASSLEQIESNVEKAIDAGLQVWRKGHFPYIPHLLHWLDLRAQNLDIPMGWSDYLLWDAPWVDECDALLFLAESKGATLELQRATEEGKLVFHSIAEIPTVKRASTWADAHIDD